MRRLTASVLAAGLVLMAGVTCAAGVVTMSEMVCCAEHQGECEMAGMVESCCGTDQHADVGMLEPERADDAPSLTALTTYHSAAASVPSVLNPRLLATPETESRGVFPDVRTRPPSHTPSF